MGFYNPIYKNELFFLPKLTFQHHLNKIYMAFYLLTWTYFNEVNGGKNLNLKEFFSWVATKKWNKTEKDRKNKEKENNSDESDFSENEIPDLNSLKPFEFEPKTNIGDINSSSSDDEEEGAEYKVKRISNNEWCECSAKAVVGRCSSK